MPSKPKAAAIEPDRLYLIAFSRRFTAPNGKEYIPRAGVTFKVRGRVLETIKDNLDHYEAV